MPHYTYLIHDPGGVVFPTTTFDLASDHESLMLAFFVIRDHPNCEEIEVWCGERRVIAKGSAEQILLKTPDQGLQA